MESPDKLPLGGFLQGSAPMVVPRYQRSYAWDKEEISDFIQDLRMVLDKRRAKSSNEQNEELYFFGAILSAQYDEPASVPGSRHEIIDGQQRLATVMLTLVVLRKALLEVWPDGGQPGADSPNVSARAMGIVEAIDNSLHFLHRDLRTGLASRRQALTLSERDREFFASIVESGPQKAKQTSPDSHKFLARACRTLEDELVQPILINEELTDKQKIDSLIELFLLITNNFYVVKLYTKADRDEAYRLFNVLNDRGVNLSDADLLRTKSLELLEDERFRSLQEDVAKSWDEIFLSKGGEISGFLAAYFASRTGQRAPKRQLYHGYLTHIFPEVRDLTDARSARAFRNLISQMASEHAAYRQLSAGEWPYSPGSAPLWMKRRLERLVTVLKRTGDIPLLLSAWAADPDDDTRFSEIVDLVERFGLRWSVAPLHSGTLSEAYYEHAVLLRIEPATYTAQTFLQRYAPFVAENAPDSSFQPALVQRLRYGKHPDNQLIKHLLTTIEDYWSDLTNSKASATPRPRMESAYDFSQIQIEHIYPQKPREQDIDESLERVLHDLGNLTFLSGDDNLNLGNKPFKEKKKEYEKASSRMTRELGMVDEWNPDVVHDRARRLIEFARRIYAVPAVSAAPVDSPPSFWAFTQRKGGNDYADVPGKQYAYLQRLPNGRQILEGDFFALLLLDGKKPHLRREFIAVGRIGAFSDTEEGTRRAVFSHYLTLPETISLSSENDPRPNKQHSMNRLSRQFFVDLLPPGFNLDSLPPVEPAIDAELTPHRP
jgi:hypothetical protein